MAQKEFTTVFPKRDGEHDANEILVSQLGVAVEAMTKIGATAEDIAAIGIPIKGKLRLCGTKRLGNRSDMQSSGSAEEHPGTVIS